MAKAIKERGVWGLSTHALRRAGTYAEVALTGPQVLRLNPMGYVCNHRCPMCWLQHLDPAELQRQKKADVQEGMSLAEYQILFDSVPHGLQEVNIVGGGEPLVHKEAVDIMREIKRRGWQGSLISNGTLLKEPVAKAMVDMKWDYTRISVHAGDPQTYAQIQGVDRFDELKENLQRFDALRRKAGATERCRLVVFHVLQKANMGSIEKLFSVAREVGADALEFDPVKPYDENMWLTAEEVRQIRARVIACAQDSGVPCKLSDIVRQLHREEASLEGQKPFVPARFCSVGFDEAFINAQGDVMPCCFSNEVMGNVREKPFPEIWYSPIYQEFRKRLVQGKFAPYCIENRCTLAGVLHQ